MGFNRMLPTLDPAFFDPAGSWTLDRLAAELVLLMEYSSYAGGEADAAGVRVPLRRFNGAEPFRLFGILC